MFESVVDEQDQLRRLLALLSTAENRPRRLHVLADAPEAVAAPAGLAVQVEPATRESLLALSRKLEGEPGPRLLVAWGHGGRQGAEPVFHVRGPRVTPADLSRLAPRAGSFRALLFFRGSGDFARALAGPEREVLASENTTSFRSDPRGLEIGLRIWGDRPSAGFGELADLLGRETVAWYEERHLARQEEPTLWAGAATARPLARAVSEAEQGTPPPAPAPASGEGWQGIAPVEAAAHPDADAVVLRSRTSVVLGDDPAIRMESDEFVQVLTPEGEARGDVDVASVATRRTRRLPRLRGAARRRDPRASSRRARRARSAVRSGPLPGRLSQGLLAPRAAPGRSSGCTFGASGVRSRCRSSSLSAPRLRVSLLEAPVEVRVGEAQHSITCSRTRRPGPPAQRRRRSGRIYTWRFPGMPPLRDEALAPPDRCRACCSRPSPTGPPSPSWYRAAHPAGRRGHAGDRGPRRRSTAARHDASARR